jgi:putative cardiolipin synthase
MHNKSFSAAHTAAIMGGRNIASDSFDAGNETNFRNLDVVAIGPMVRETSRIFDELAGALGQRDATRVAAVRRR